MTLLGRIFHTGCEREATIRGGALGLLAGAVTGAVATTLMFAALALMGGEAPQSALMVFPVALVIWALGLLALGLPGWLVLHRLGARCQQAAMIYGGGLTFLVVLAVQLPAFLLLLSPGTNYSAGDGGGATVVDGVLTLHGWVQAVTSAGMMAIVGVVVGWTVARIAYAPVKS